MESMDLAPYSVPAARYGARMGQSPMVDLMEHDGLYCAFDKCLMGATSDKRNAELGIGRAEQDEWAAASHRLAAAAAAAGAFDAEIAPVAVPQRKGDPVIVAADEGIRPDSTAAALGKPAARLRQGRDHHRRQRLADLQRRRRPGDRRPRRRRGGGPAHRRRDRLLRADRRPRRHPPRTARPGAASRPWPGPASAWATSTWWS